MRFVEDVLGLFTHVELGNGTLPPEQNRAAAGILERRGMGGVRASHRCDAGKGDQATLPRVFQPHQGSRGLSARHGYMTRPEERAASGPRFHALRARLQARLPFLRCLPDQWHNRQEPRCGPCRRRDQQPAPDHHESAARDRASQAPQGTGPATGLYGDYPDGTLTRQGDAASVICFAAQPRASQDPCRCRGGSGKMQRVFRDFLTRVSSSIWQNGHGHQREKGSECMSLSTILVVVLLVMLLGGGGLYWRRRS